MLACLRLNANHLRRDEAKIVLAPAIRKAKKRKAEPTVRLRKAMGLPLRKGEPLFDDQFEEGLPIKHGINAAASQTYRCAGHVIWLTHLTHLSYQSISSVFSGTVCWFRCFKTRIYAISLPSTHFRGALRSYWCSCNASGHKAPLYARVTSRPVSR